jgi:hypothetical protein
MMNLFNQSWPAYVKISHIYRQPCVKRNLSPICLHTFRNCRVWLVALKKNLPVCYIRQVQMCLQRYRPLSPVKNLCDAPLVMKSWANLVHHRVYTATTTLDSCELVSCNATRSSRWRNNESQGRSQSALMLLSSAFKEAVILLWQCHVCRSCFVLFTGRNKLQPFETYKC